MHESRMRRTGTYDLLEKTKPEERICEECSELKLIEEFAIRNGKNWFSKICKSCRSINNRVKRKYENLHRHGIDINRYNEMLEEQGGGCGICGHIETEVTKSGEIKRLVVHHDHNCCSGKYSCGKCVIALLCSNCNTGIGMLQDNLEYLFKAYQLMLKYKQSQEV